MSNQSRKLSVIEVVSNVGSGYLINLGIQIMIFPFFDVHISVASNVLLTCIFTVSSLFRGYVVRRLFNNFKRK
jgi:hypothetical protein